MRYLILTDIHGNIDALDEVLRRVAEEGFDEVLVLGDLVGYGAGPNRVPDFSDSTASRTTYLPSSRRS